ncbi:MAG: ATP-dependent DNA helicase [Christensenellaceae bacterium]|jgi:DNA excision repair protein ERCC-2|nr:ATP-dependent DNA helicase [Christensenellaceae bacterium]
MRVFRVAARALVEEVLRRGDLQAGGSVSRLLQGAEGHRLLQAEGGARNEVALVLTIARPDLSLTIHGRIDRLWESPPCIEEIKTTGLPPSLIGEEDFPPHWAQAFVYGYIYASQNGLSSIAIRLTYLNPQSGERLSFTKEKALSELSAFFSSLVEPYLAFLRAGIHHQSLLAGEIAALRFPFPSLRKGQADLMQAAARCLQGGGRLLAEAPTGIGKTLSLLFPTLQALGRGEVNRIFYLSARGTGKAAALDCLCGLGLNNLRAIELAAKEKLCPFARSYCENGACPNAKGYYDRLPEALAWVLRQKSPYTMELLQKTALEHSLCPHEFSLDLSLHCEILIGDYNYAFDPRARLQRFFGGGRRQQALLIDEAHNLPARSREMFSAEIGSALFAPLERAAKGAKNSPGAAELAAFLREVKACFAQEDKPSPFFEMEPPPFLEALQALFPRINEENFSAEIEPLRECFWAAEAFLRCAGEGFKNSLALYSGEGRSWSVRLLCLDASPMLEEIYKKAKSVVLFSATLSPSPFYARLCGLPGAETLALPSPFPAENLRCLHLPLEMRYSRREGGYAPAADAAAAFVKTKKRGNFLVFCPSFAYMQRFQIELMLRLSGAKLFAQKQGMGEAERAAFLARFSAQSEGLQVGLAVLGGVFAEAIDLPGERLSGAVLLGVGLPQIAPENEALRWFFDERAEDGFAYAYVYPGLTRVLQAAGRVIRGEDDRGALLLIDERYGRPPYPDLLPPAWNPLPVDGPKAIAEALEGFWEE